MPFVSIDLWCKTNRSRVFFGAWLRLCTFLLGGCTTMMNKNLLDELWDSHFSERKGKRGNEETELIDSILEDERVLRGSLTEKQKDLYDKIEASVSERSDILEREAFIKGVRFGSFFVLETFCKEG